MGYPPPTAGPPPPLATVAAQTPTASLALSTPPLGGTIGLSTPTLVSFTICGFTFVFPPPLSFVFSFELPSLSLLLQLPSIYFYLSINCNILNPLAVGAGLAYGGGRVSNADPDPDQLEAYQEAA